VRVARSESGNRAFFRRSATETPTSGRLYGGNRIHGLNRASDGNATGRRASPFPATTRYDLAEQIRPDIALRDTELIL
jgi:hypothetical protein